LQNGNLAAKKQNCKNNTTYCKLHWIVVSAK